MVRYNQTEFLICVAARELKDGASAFIGTGIPMLAAALAKRTHAPSFLPIFEFGGSGAPLQELPLSVADIRTFYKAYQASSMTDIMEMSAKGFVEYGFLGGAQIDQYGNLNSTQIGTHENPKVRFPGSGGANDVGSLCWRTIAVMVTHDVRKFTNKLDFLTTPGYLDGPGSREEVGLPPDSGPYRVVSSLGLFDYEEDSKRMRLIQTHPGVTVEQVLESTGFELLVADDVTVTVEPTEEEIRILREEVDPKKFYI